MLLSCSTCQKEEKECIQGKYLIHAVLLQLQICRNLRVFFRQICIPKMSQFIKKMVFPSLGQICPTVFLSLGLCPPDQKTTIDRSVGPAFPKQPRHKWLCWKISDISFPCMLNRAVLFQLSSDSDQCTPSRYLHVTWITTIWNSELSSPHLLHG